ncbi:hypothetical protein ACFPES_09745 [Paenibacillus sp. GCM10023248]|uniref:hypothetical protein n=1 Tax=Bacillales TaxID=1385 RepID=UPI002379A136|nr:MULTISPECIES: hypothetical protein [Bacillales]MDD9267302.1 hypothetical protein [Paenibacillus sp. MAHUQ-63]MDR6884803.1 hypothetical protein [Bacillus sp. 3255]
MVNTVAGWMIYTLWAIFGLMIVHFLISFFRTFWEGTFDFSFVLDYLKDVLYYILPLNVLVNLSSIDPTGWILVIFYFICGIAVILKYLLDFRKIFQ